VALLAAHRRDSGWQPYRPAGAAIKAETMRTSTSIKGLDLGNDIIGDDGACLGRKCGILGIESVKQQRLCWEQIWHGQLELDRVRLDRAPRADEVCIWGIAPSTTMEQGPSLKLTRRLVCFLLKHRTKTLEKRDVPLIVQVVRRDGICPALTAGFIYRRLRPQLPPIGRPAKRSMRGNSRER
jgi:hypothetical protein